MREDILNVIETNSRISMEELAVRLGADKEQVVDEITAMEKEGVICGYNTLINWDNMDCDKVTALIEIKVTPQRGQGFEKIAERIYKFDEVESVYLMSGGYDLTVFIRGKNMKEISNFVWNKLAPLESVTSTATYFVLKKYKEHGVALVNTAKEDERMLIAP
ncbi:MAG: Lrp/AsnC family transcriptional regulator [Lachnospiraceae bacterium]|nr:Lrp/AsnC family transcriptional regulator [Lachnospiraceae bacterium]